MAEQTLGNFINEMYGSALKRIAPNRRSSPAEITPMQAMFMLAVDGVTNSPLAQLGEESITAALVGRMAAHFTWTVSGLGMDGEKPALWGQYSKNGQGQDAESNRGADFALVIPITDDIVRIAIFQAKKATHDVGDVSQKGSETSAVWQYSKLAETAAIVELTALESAADIDQNDEGSWVHYVFWQDAGKAPKSISVKAIDPLLKKSLNRIDLMDQAFQNFADLLLSGLEPIQANRSSHVIDGWLQLDTNTAITCLPELLAITDVVFADERGGGKALVNKLVSTSVASTNTQIQKQSALSKAHITKRTSNVSKIKGPK